MIVLGIDPGAKGAGYCLWSGRPLGVSVDLHPMWTQVVDAIVVEEGFIGVMGKKGMWGLGFDAAWRMAEARVRFPHAKLLRIEPTAWRKALPEAHGTFKCYTSGDGDVIVNRLRDRYRRIYGIAPETEHEVEACGIAEAAAAILARPKAKDRRALKPVKR